MVPEKYLWCMFCVHFSFDGGEPDYSEITPGYPGHLRCFKGYWNLGAKRYGGFTEKDFRKAMHTAKTCKDYEAIGEVYEVMEKNNDV